MAEEFILTRDIIQDHSERMLNIKKYYPYFKLTENAFTQFAGGRFEELATMHKIQAKEFTRGDFSCEKMSEEGLSVLDSVIAFMEKERVVEGSLRRDREAALRKGAYYVKRDGR